MSKFQSHNGAIAAPHRLKQPVGGGSFNPTMVRLLLVSIALPEVDDFSFNPTMVRLLQVVDRHLLRHPLLFQSHNGAIAAVCPQARVVAVKAVSIPQRCDCCSSRKCQQGRDDQFQSHNGAIAALRLVG